MEGLAAVAVGTPNNAFLYFTLEGVDALEKPTSMGDVERFAADVIEVQDYGVALTAIHARVRLLIFSNECANGAALSPMTLFGAR